jgi:hypothetical protein
LNKVCLPSKDTDYEDLCVTDGIGTHYIKYEMAMLGCGCPRYCDLLHGMLGFISLNAIMSEITCSQNHQIWNLCSTEN